MLQQTFKRATDLGIDETLYEALVELYWRLKERFVPAKLFDMSCIGTPRLRENVWCGTPGCFMGHVNGILAANGYSGRMFVDGPTSYNQELRSLFYPSHVSRMVAERLPCNFMGEVVQAMSGPNFDNTMWKRLSLAQATLALQRYLETGVDGWVEAVLTLDCDVA